MWLAGARTCLERGQEAQSAIGQPSRVMFPPLERADILGALSPASRGSNTGSLDLEGTTSPKVLQNRHRAEDKDGGQ